MSDAAPTTALPVPDGGTDAVWRETSTLYFRAAVERLYWQDIAVMHLRVTNCGNIPPRCIPGRSPMAKCSRNAFPRRPTVARSRRGAFPGGDPWQLFHFMRSRRGLGREKRPFLAAYRRRASETSRLRQDIRAMHPKSAASSRLGIHRAKILPGRGPFRCAGPSDHARHADLAVVRRSPGAGPYAWKAGTRSRNRTPHCCRRSRVPARHLVAFCGGSLSRSRTPRPAARCARSHDPPLRSPRPLSVGSGFP